MQKFVYGWLGRFLGNCETYYFWYGCAKCMMPEAGGIHALHNPYKIFRVSQTPVESFLGKRNEVAACLAQSNIMQG